MRPLRADTDWIAVAVERSVVAELQAFYEANPEYWLMVYGHKPQSDEALQDIEARPPPDMPYSALPMWLIRDRTSGHILGEVSVATDLLADGVTHLGFFIVDAAHHGTGLASEIYSSYEAWAVGNEARWLRLGVVEGNRRGHRFWLRNGYVEVRRRQNYVIGDLSHTLIVMVKPVASNTVDDYLALVPRDRPES